MKERIEDKEGSEVVKRFKENLDQMMRIKISKLIGDVKDYKFVDHARVIDNCLGNFIVIDCTNDKLTFYKYVDKTVKKKTIEYKPREKSIVVKTTDSKNISPNVNKMIGNIKSVNFIKKHNLIYMIICDEDGKEFISCI